MTSNSLIEERPSRGARLEVLLGGENGAAPGSVAARKAEINPM
jgi:hypothetical protein